MDSLSPRASSLGVVMGHLRGKGPVCMATLFMDYRELEQLHQALLALKLAPHEFYLHRCSVP